MSLQFNQITIKAKEFYKIKQLTDLMNINVDKIVVSNSFYCNKGKDMKFIIGYQTKDAAIVPLLIKTPKYIFSPQGVTQYNENSTYCMGFDLEGYTDWINQYRLIWKAVEEQMSQSLTKESVNKERYINPKLNIYDGEIKTIFHNKHIPENQRCEATAILKIASVYKQGNNYYPQVFVEECKYKSIESPSHRLLSSDSEDEGFVLC